MISDAALKRGLLELAEASSRKLDAHTEAMWRKTTRELTEDQWKHGVDVVLKTWRSSWMPPPGLVIEAAYTAPLPPKRIDAPREDGQFWSSETQAQHAFDTVRDNPKRSGESVFAYIRRIAVLAGLMSPRPGIESHEARLPYKESEERVPGEEG